MPGKGARQRNREKYRTKRQNDKIAKRAAYASLIGTDKNVKKKHEGSAKGKTIRPRTHPQGNCGNIGCGKCFPQFKPDALGF